jgi:hypothetical protein
MGHRTVNNYNNIEMVPVHPKELTCIEYEIKPEVGYPC